MQSKSALTDLDRHDVQLGCQRLAARQGVGPTALDPDLEAVARAGDEGEVLTALGETALVPQHVRGAVAAAVLGQAGADLRAVVLKEAGVKPQLLAGAAPPFPVM